MEVFIIKSMFWYDLPPGRIGIIADQHAVYEILLRPQESDLPLAENQLVRATAQQLAEYCSGARKEFDLPLCPEGTPFQLEVWDALLSIPYGETCSYADIARRIGRPKACRAVGLANGKNPLSIVIPCHRVIGANGTLTGYGGGLEMKRFLLDLEQKHL